MSNQANQYKNQNAPLLMATPVATFPSQSYQQQQPYQATLVQPNVVVMNRAPVQEHVVFNSIIEDYLVPSQGLLIREKQWLSQIACGACEKQVQFKVANWDQNVPDAAEDHEFTSRPAQFMIKEQSECCQRYCFHQMRELKLGVFPMGGTMHDTNESSGWPQNVDRLLEFDKPCAAPIPCCCCLLCAPEMKVTRPAQIQRNVPEEYFGRVVFDWKWWNCCFPCEHYMSVKDHNDQELYVLRRAMCCSMKDGCCVNMCAPSCCNLVHRTSIEDVNGNQVGEMKNIFPGYNVRGLCQGNSAADNFALIYPNDANVRDKSLLLAGMMLTNFVYWERRANQDQNGGGGFSNY